MYLSDRELGEAIKTGRLILDPFTVPGPTSIDLHLDKVDQAKVWDIDKFIANNRVHGRPDLELATAQCRYGALSREYLTTPPKNSKNLPADCKVFRRDDSVIIKPGGFVLWQTKEKVGTPEEGPELICFVDGKSTRARTGLVVHLTAPTIHAGWSGNVTLEIANFGPFHFILSEDDVVAQITVAQISSPPSVNMRATGSTTVGQTDVTGKPS